MQYYEQTMSAAKNVVESLRDVVQDLLVPELKAVKVSVDSLHTEISYLRGEMKLREEKMEQLIHAGDARLEQLLIKGDDRLEQIIINGEERLEQLTITGDGRLEQLIVAGHERLEQIIRSGDEKSEQAVRDLGQRLDDAIEIRERLAAIEARLPRQ